MIPTSFEEALPYFETLENESDRACAVLSGSLLDELLKNLLKRVMIEEAATAFEGNGPLSRWNSKTLSDVAFFLGHLSRDEYDEINLIRKIRNDFAHRLEANLDFNDTQIQRNIQKLKLPLVSIAIKGLTNGATPIELKRRLEQPRTAFVYSVRILAGFLINRCQEFERPETRESFASKIDLQSQWTKRYWEFYADKLEPQMEAPNAKIESTCSPESSSL